MTLLYNFVCSSSCFMCPVPRDSLMRSSIFSSYFFDDNLDVCWDSVPDFMAWVNFRSNFSFLSSFQGWNMQDGRSETSPPDITRCEDGVWSWRHSWMRVYSLSFIWRDCKEGGQSRQEKKVSHEKAWRHAMPTMMERQETVWLLSDKTVSSSSSSSFKTSSRQESFSIIYCNSDMRQTLQTYFWWKTWKYTRGFNLEYFAKEINEEVFCTLTFLDSSLSLKLGCKTKSSKDSRPRLNGVACRSMCSIALILKEHFNRETTLRPKCKLKRVETRIAFESVALFPKSKSVDCKVIKPLRLP